MGLNDIAETPVVILATYLTFLAILAYFDQLQKQNPNVSLPNIGELLCQMGRSKRDNEKVRSRYQDRKG